MHEDNSFKMLIIRERLKTRFEEEGLSPGDESLDSMAKFYYDIYGFGHNEEVYGMVVNAYRRGRDDRNSE